MKTPDELYPDLFYAVQMADILGDGKTFVDATPRQSAASIRQAYAEGQREDDWSLADFVEEHFDMPPTPGVGKRNQARDIDEHIASLWSDLRRPAQLAQEGSSLLTLPHDYIVPGGRFREIYYWDSYFTMQGLLRQGHIEIVKAMVNNFVHLIDTYGHIPNGNRSYFLSRSQPPFFAMMVDLLCQYDGDSSLSDYHDAMRREYAFWMDGADDLAEGGAHRRVVRIGDHILNRYYDDVTTPRQESHREDYKIGSGLDDAESFYRHLRAACESGWDFSSRWMTDAEDLSTIHTCDIVPIDLNCLLYRIEVILAESVLDEDARMTFAAKAETRKAAIHDLLWYGEGRYYSDYDWRDESIQPQVTAAMVVSMYTGICTEMEALQMSETLSRDLIVGGGILTTAVESGQQWDAPNGWPPLQWMAAMGLRRYGLHDLAREVAQGYMRGCEMKYAQDGKMIEKYNVLNPLATAKGGEYEAQDGFGWSNGVYVALKEEFAVMKEEVT